jgi:hypothetical protein
MTVFMDIFFAVLVILGYLVAPVSLIWGWIRWKVLPRYRTVPATLSLIGFACASASGLLAIAAVLYAQLGGVNSEESVVRWFLLPGGLLSFLGLLLSLGGIWRSSALRWFAPVGTVATLAFWLLTTSFLD